MDPATQPTIEITSFSSRCTILTLRGALEDVEVAKAEAFLRTVVDSDPDLFILDVTGLKIVAQSLVRTVLQAQDEMRGRGHQLLIEGPDLVAGGVGSELDDAFAAYRRTVFRTGRHQRAG